MLPLAGGPGRPPSLWSVCPISRREMRES